MTQETTNNWAFTFYEGALVLESDYFPRFNPQESLYQKGWVYVSRRLLPNNLWWKAGWYLADGTPIDATYVPDEIKLAAILLG